MYLDEQKRSKELSKKEDQNKKILTELSECQKKTTAEREATNLVKRADELGRLVFLRV